MPIQLWSSKWKSLGKWPLPCQIVFVLKPLTQTQQTADDADQDYKHKSRLVICGNFAAWGEHSTTTANLDAPLLRLMLSLACAPDTTWSSIEITGSFLNADEDDTWTSSSPTQSGMSRSHLWTARSSTPMATRTRPEASRTRVPLHHKFAHLVQSHIHPSLWFIAEGAVAEHN